jgi:hypothetical protein
MKLHLFEELAQEVLPSAARSPLKKLPRTVRRARRVLGKVARQSETKHRARRVDEDKAARDDDKALLEAVELIEDVTADIIELVMGAEQPLLTDFTKLFGQALRGRPPTPNLKAWVGDD